MLQTTIMEMDKLNCQLDRWWGGPTDNNALIAGEECYGRGDGGGDDGVNAMG